MGAVKDCEKAPNHALAQDSRLRRPLVKGSTVRREQMRGYSDPLKLRARLSR